MTGSSATIQVYGIGIKASAEMKSFGLPDEIVVREVIGCARSPSRTTSRGHQGLPAWCLEPVIRRRAAAAGHGPSAI